MKVDSLLRARRPRLTAIAASLGGIALVTACGPGAHPAATATPSPVPTPSIIAPFTPSVPVAGPAAAAPTPALLNFNPRSGNNRAASEAALAVARNLYGQGQFWEVYVKTTPDVLPGRIDPLDPGSWAATGREAKSVLMILATENGNTIQKWIKSGHGYEADALNTLCRLLTAAFPSAEPVTVETFYGESDLHSTATYSHGHLSEKFGDKF